MTTTFLPFEGTKRPLPTAAGAAAASTNILAATKEGIRPFKIRPCQSAPKPDWVTSAPVAADLARVVPVYFYGAAPVLLALIIEHGYQKELLRRQQEQERKRLGQGKQREQQLRDVVVHQPPRALLAPIHIGTASTPAHAHAKEDTDGDETMMDIAE